MLSTVLNSRLSSANSRASEDLQASGIYECKEMQGPRTMPWGTPDSTSASLEWVPSNSTVCFLCPRKDLIHLFVLFLSPVEQSPMGYLVKGFFEVQQYHVNLILRLFLGL